MSKKVACHLQILFRPLLLSTAVILSADGVAQAQQVKLVPQPDLAKGIASFPHLAPEVPHSAKINAAVDKIQGRVLAVVADCKKAGNGESDFNRSIDVTMQGPRFVSFVVRDAFVCGGPHPNASKAAFVYDLTTGKPADWLHLLPAAVAGKAVAGSTTGDVVLGLLQSPALKRAYVEDNKASGVDNDCLDAYKEMKFSFMLWPDAEKRGLVLDQDDLPWSMKHCGGGITLSLDKLRKLGVGEELIDAIRSGEAAPAVKKRADRAEVPASQDNADGVAGTYERKSEEVGNGSIKVEKVGSIVRMTFDIGGIPRGPNGGGTSADCGFVAEGKVDAGAFVGMVTAEVFLGEEKKVAAGAGYAPIKASILNGKILVQEVPTTDLCGDWTDVRSGSYVRAAAK